MFYSDLGNGCALDFVYYISGLGREEKKAGLNGSKSEIEENAAPVWYANLKQYKINNLLAN
jgi:hypothetical protein